MKSIVSKGLKPIIKKKNVSKIVKTSLALTLIVFAFTMSSPSSFFQFVKPVEAAGTLTSIAIIPTNNIVNTRTTYDIILKTATTGTIKTIHMTFPNSFDVSAATRIIEKSGIGSGSFSPSCSISSCELKYTVSNPVSLPAGTTIRLEIARIVNSDTAGSFNVGISTEAQVILDGPTLSPSFPIKAIGTNDISNNAVTNSKIAGSSVTSSKIADNSITGDDVSTGFMKSKTLNDDSAGHAHGWNPNNNLVTFTISDGDVHTDSRIIVNVLGSTVTTCNVWKVNVGGGGFSVGCDFDEPPYELAKLAYVIVNLPNNVVASSLSSPPSPFVLPFASLH